MAVKFNLPNDSRDYTLGFDFNELADAEAVAEVNLLASVASWPNLSCRQMRGLVYALLKPAHPRVLLKEAGELLTRDMQTVYKAVKQTLLEAELLVADAAAADVPDSAPGQPEA